MQVKELHFTGLGIKRITVVHCSGGTDVVMFEAVQTDPLESPFPKLEASEPGMYPPVFRLECHAGHGEKWLMENFGIEATDPDLTVVRV